MAFQNLRELYLHQLRDLYSAENQLSRALPQLARAASAPELQAALKQHHKQTREQARRLDQVFAQLGESPAGQRCKAMAALIKEAKDLIKEGGEPAVLDAGLIAAAQKVEHYEISGYGSARTLASMLRDDEAAELLQTTLNEEGTADETLAELAEATLSLDGDTGRTADIGLYGDTRVGGTDFPGNRLSEADESEPLAGAGQGAVQAGSLPAETLPTDEAAAGTDSDPAARGDLDREAGLVTGEPEDEQDDRSADLRLPGGF